MKCNQKIFTTILILFFSVTSEACDISSLLQEGDIIFQKSQSRQSKAIKEVTGSEWTHVGMIFLHKNKWSVYEAVQPVKITPLEHFIRRGKDKAFEIKRYQPNLSKEQKSKLKQEASKYLGLPYDILFEPSDKAIYCSELIWKVYKRSLGVEIGHFVPFYTLNYRSSEALKLARTRYSRSDRHFQLSTWKKQKVITPVAMMNSSKVQPTLSSESKEYKSIILSSKCL